MCFWTLFFIVSVSLRLVSPPPYRAECCLPLPPCSLPLAAGQRAWAHESAPSAPPASSTACRASRGTPPRSPGRGLRTPSSCPCAPPATGPCPAAPQSNSQSQTRTTTTVLVRSRRQPRWWWWWSAGGGRPGGEPPAQTPSFSSPSSQHQRRQGRGQGGRGQGLARRPGTCLCPSTASTPVPAAPRARATSCTLVRPGASSAAKRLHALRWRRSQPLEPSAQAPQHLRRPLPPPPPLTISSLGASLGWSARGEAR
mmetsp:Transcript_23093/g.47222  ORF Transcript_23093/g.47222 Transcript_23093/m.47222 type:complete len:255 (-) Transcript_23093:332-1096(-)